MANIKHKHLILQAASISVCVQILGLILLRSAGKSVYFQMSVYYCLFFPGLIASTPLEHHSINVYSGIALYWIAQFSFWFAIAYLILFLFQRYLR